MRSAVLAVIYGFFGTLVSGLLILGPLAFFIEARAAGDRIEAVAKAEGEIAALVEDGSILALAFPDGAALPAARRREPMRRASCEDTPLDLKTPDVRAFAALCLNSDGSGRRLFVVGIAWDEAAPIRGALRGLHRLRDVAGFGWVAPEQMGVVLYQEIWP